MVIDDEESMRELLRDLLEREGHVVVEAADGRAGVMLYRDAPTDLIILDIFMPGRSGLEAMVDLHGEFPDARIIAISGGGNVGDIGQLGVAETLGAIRTFNKPFEIDEFLGAVNEVLGAGS